MYVLMPGKGVKILTYYLSDGPTPDIKAQQILAIAPILPGQKSHAHFETSPSQPPQPVTAMSLASNATGDLIDFGQSEAEPGQASNDGQHQVSRDQPLHLQDPLEPGYPVKRVDTMTHDLDEFVDAKP